MIDPNKLSQIKQLVQTSSILTAQEKQDWLALTALMNDKQLAELEEILKQPKPTQAPAEPQVGIPKLGVKATQMPHISNMPSQLSHHRASPVPGRTITETPKAPIRLTPMQQESPSAETIAPPVNDIRDAQERPASGRIRPMGRDDDDTTVSLESLSDVSAVSANILSGPYRPGFYQKLVELVSKNGYFQVLTRLEQSPLYHDYIEYGQQKLTGRASNTLPLSQEEFEFMTDLLLALKINRF